MPSRSQTRSQQSRGLHSRLEELLVFVIEKDGGSSYKNLTVRSLYTYVMASIRQTKNPTKQQQQRQQQPQQQDNGGRGDDLLNIDDIQQSMMGGGQKKKKKTSIRSRAMSIDDSSSSMLDQLALGRAVANTPLPPPPPPPPRTGMPVRSTSDATATAFTFNNNINNVGNSGNNVTYRERLGSYLNFRDIRKIVTPFSAWNEPEIVVRRHCILVNFDPLRAIILRDRLLIKVPDGADSILVELEKKIRGNDMFDESTSDDNHNDMLGKNNTLPVATGTIDNEISTTKGTDETSDVDLGSYTNSHHPKDRGEPNEDGKGNAVNSDEDDDEDESDDLDRPMFSLADEWDELDKADWVDLPFELQCLDAVLTSSSDILGDDVLDLQLAANNMIVQMLEPRSDVGDHAQEILRVMKNSTRELISRVRGFNRAIDTTLQDYEDMSLMNLGRLITHPERFIQPVPQAVLDEESDEPELILEAAIQRGHSLKNALDLIDNQVSSIEDFAERKIDTIRNRILSINMMLTTLALAVAIGSFIGSLFGMNTLNGYEETTKAFLPIVFITLAFMICFVVGVFLIVRHIGALPRMI